MRHVSLLTIPCHSDIVFMEQKRERTAPPTVRSFSHIPVCLPYTESCPTCEAPAPPTYTMIRENSLFCKLIRIKNSSKALFGSFMAGFRPKLQTCPCHPPGLHHPLLRLRPVLPPPRPGGVFPAPFHCGEAMRTLLRHPFPAAPVAAALPGTEGGMARCTLLHGGFRPFLPESPARADGLFGFRLRLCPPFYKVLPPVP